MFFSHSIPLLLALLPLDVRDLLREPDYHVIRDGEVWILQKPGAGMRQPITISRHQDQSAAEFRRRSLPRLRLSTMFVRFDPATYERTLVADWTAHPDAQQIEADVREILHRFAPTGAEALLQSTPVYMARLSGATGHTAEESGDHARLSIYVDPFRATGRLHLAATILHELRHVQRYRERGFHANRAAAALPKQDFVLLGLADEFAAYEAEANLVRSFLTNQRDEARKATRYAICNPQLNWPLALSIMLGFEGSSEQGRRTSEAQCEVVLDVERTAGLYWEARHMDPIDARLRDRIRHWYNRSREWREISAQRPAWRKADSEPGCLDR